MQSLSAGRPRRPPRPPNGEQLPLTGGLDCGNACASQRDKRRLCARHRDSTVLSASTSFFGLPRNLSSGSLRNSLNLPPPPPGSIDWVSIAVVYFVTLVSEASRGLMLPSTWPYLRSLGGSKSMLGVFVAVFSVGRMATTIPLGYLSDRWNTSAVLIVASSIQVVGHVMYALAPSVPVLMASRVVVGFGSATMSVCRAHLTRAVPQRTRTHHFAYLSALQFVGFAVLPGVGGLLAQVPELRPLPILVLNGFTYPAWLLVLCNLLVLFAIYALYLNPPSRRTRAVPVSYGATSSQPHGGLQPSRPPVTSISMLEDSTDDRSADFVALVVCLLINVSFRGIVAELETVSTPFLMERYGVTYSGASYYITAMGFLGLAVYLFFKPIARRFSDRNLVLYGLSFVMLGCVPLSIAPLTRLMPKWVYVGCIGAMWSLAYPVGQTAVLALFSKVLADLPAGGFLGIFSASGSLARVVFAMLAGRTWGALGREAVFACILGYIVPAIVLCVWAYKRLVPPEEDD